MIPFIFIFMQKETNPNYRFGNMWEEQTQGFSCQSNDQIDMKQIRKKK